MYQVAYKDAHFVPGNILVLGISSGRDMEVTYVPSTCQLYLREGGTKQRRETRENVWTSKKSRTLGNRLDYPCLQGGGVTFRTTWAMAMVVEG